MKFTNEEDLLSENHIKALDAIEETLKINSDRYPLDTLSDSYKTVLINGILILYMKNEWPIEMKIIDNYLVKHPAANQFCYNPKYAICKNKIIQKASEFVGAHAASINRLLITVAYLLMNSIDINYEHQKDNYPYIS